jgi:hypothetical protein
MAAAQQMGQLALHLGAGGPVVGQPVGLPLAGAGGQQLGLLGVDADRAAGQAGGAGSRSGQTLQARPNRACPSPWLLGRIATVTLAGQVTVPWARSTRNAVLA